MTTKAPIKAGDMIPGVHYRNMRGNAHLVFVRKLPDGRVLTLNLKNQTETPIQADYALFELEADDEVAALLATPRDRFNPDDLHPLDDEKLDKLDDQGEPWLCKLIEEERKRRADPFADDEAEEPTEEPEEVAPPAPAPAPVPAPAPAARKPQTPEGAAFLQSQADEWVVVSYNLAGEPVQIDDVLTLAQDAAGEPYVAAVGRSDGQIIPRKFDNRTGYSLNADGEKHAGRRLMQRTDAPQLPSKAPPPLELVEPDPDDEVQDAPPPAPVPAPAPTVVGAGQLSAFANDTERAVADFLRTRRDSYPRGYVELVAGLAGKAPDARALCAPVKDPEAWPATVTARKIGVDVGDALQDAADFEASRGAKSRDSVLDLYRRWHANARTTFPGAAWRAPTGAAAPPPAPTPAPAPAAPATRTAGEVTTTRGADAEVPSGAPPDLSALPWYEQVGKVSTVRACELIGDLIAKPDGVTFDQYEQARESVRDLPAAGRLCDLLDELAQRIALAPEPSEEANEDHNPTAEQVEPVEQVQPDPRDEQGNPPIAEVAKRYCERGSKAFTLGADLAGLLDSIRAECSGPPAYLDGILNAATEGWKFAETERNAGRWRTRADVAANVDQAERAADAATRSDDDAIAAAFLALGRAVPALRRSGVKITITIGE